VTRYYCTCPRPHFRPSLVVYAAWSSLGFIRLSQGERGKRGAPVYLARTRGDVFGKEIYSRIYRVLRGRRERRTGETHASWCGQETRRGLRAAQVSGSSEHHSRAARLYLETKLSLEEEETGWKWVRKIEEGRRASTCRGGGWYCINE